MGSLLKSVQTLENADHVIECVIQRRKDRGAQNAGDDDDLGSATVEEATSSELGGSENDSIDDGHQVSSVNVPLL